MESRLRASPEQFSLLLEFMESHGDLSRPQTGLQGRTRSERLWQELAEILNSVGGSGITKTAEKWKRVWSDWKTKTKKKASIENRDIHGTGGGPGRGRPLSRHEERVLRILGETSITGQAIQEAGFQEQPQPQVRRAADTPERVPSPVHEMEILVIPEHTPTSVPADTNPPISQARPVSPVPGPSNSSINRTIRGETSPLSAGPSTPRRRRQRRLRQTPFDRATSAFVAVEENRLRFERERDARLHEREMERLKIEGQRLQLDRERAEIEKQRVRVEEVRTRLETDLRDSLHQLNLKITALISLMETRD